jgi:hypothetical protein
MGNSPATLPAGFFDQPQSNTPPPSAAPDTLPADFFSRATPQSATTQSASAAPDTLPANFFSQPHTEAAPAATSQPEGDGSFASKAWSWLNEPLTTSLFGLASHRQGAGGFEAGAEDFLSGMTSPLSVGLAVASFGESAVEQGLVKAGAMTLTEAAGIVQKAKLAGNVGFLAKYGYDLGTNTLPQAELMWGDYRSAKNENDKAKALTRLEQFGTESLLNAVATGMATKGVAHDLEEMRATSPKGKAMMQVQYADGTYGYQESNQVGVGQAHDIFKHFSKQIPDEKRRIAIGMSIEANADPNVLEKWAQRAEANPATKDEAPLYRAAKQLSDKEIEARDQLKQILNADLAHLKFKNLLPEDGGKANYLPHRHTVEDLDPTTGKPVERTLMDSDRDFLKKRKFDSYADAQQAGLTPTTKDAVRLISDYHEKVSNLLGRNDLGEKLASSYTNEGAPMAAPGKLMPGYTRPMDAPVDPGEISRLKAAGKFDELLKSGRIYEVPGEPAETLNAPAQTQAIVKSQPSNKLMGEAPQMAQFVKAEKPAQPAYMWKQSDYVPTGLSVWRPVTAAEAAQLPQSAIVPFGSGPVPEQAIMEKGMQGIPTDAAAQAPKVANARVPVYAHPDIAPHLNAMLESTAPKNALLRAALKASSEAKSDLLSLSPFHWATILNRTLESGMNPLWGTNRKMLFVPKDIDYFNLSDAQKSAIRDGVVASSTRPGFSGYLGEGLVGEKNSLINKIPLIGNFNRAIEERLFGPSGWITSLKFDLYDKLKGQIMKSKPDLDETQAGRIAASQVNNKFGGLNYTVMGRSASTQNTLRALLLAPDFLESTGRSVLDVAGGHGGTLVKSLIAFNASQWLLARGINYLTSGDTHPEAGFGVQSKDGKREYTLRTTLGDFLHFVEKPRDFAMNRVNPLLVRAPGEWIEGVDQQGHKISSAQKVFDTLRQVTPIPLQGLYPNQQVSQPGALDKTLQGVGIGSHKIFTPAQTLAMQLASKKSQGAPLEGEELASAQRRYKLEDDLRDAINSRDQQGRMNALKAIHQAASGAEAKISEKQATDIIEKANKYPMPIMATVARLDLADALQVWGEAGLTEQRALRPLISGKIQKFQESSAGRTRAENQEMRERIQAFRMSLAR